MWEWQCQRPYRRGTNWHKASLRRLPGHVSTNNAERSIETVLRSEHWTKLLEERIQARWPYRLSRRHRYVPAGKKWIAERDESLRKSTKDRAGLPETELTRTNQNCCGGQSLSAFNG